MKLRKIYNLSIVCWLMAALLTSCFDDKGNYDYQNINEVTIEGIDRTKVYELFSYESTLTINPVVKSTVGDEKNYDYTWKIIPKNAESEEGDQEKYVVSKEKNLVYPVTLDDGYYIGFFEVKDLSNGVTWIEDFYLHVKSKGSEGWIIACKQDGKTRLDLITKESSGKNVLFPDLWNSLDFDMGEPKRLFYLAGMEAEFMFPLLVTDKSTYSIMGNDFHVGEDTDMKWYFGLSDGTIDMTASVIEQYSTTWLSNWWVINSKGEILGKHTGLYNYTIGQRKGLGISYSKPLFVLGFNKIRNEVIVGEEEELYKKEMTVTDINLLLIDEIKDWMPVQVKARYSSKVADAKIRQEGNCIKVVFDEPQRAITPGQSAVFYVGDIVLGGGKIV